MDERDLNALIRMATEAEQMEQDSNRSFQWARAKSSRRDVLMQRLTGIGGLAAAACLALMVVAWLRAPQGTTPVPANVAVKPEVHADKPVIAKAKAPEQGSVMLAVFHDADDRCSCVQLRQDAFGKGRDLTQVGGSEMLRTAIAGGCHENPEKVLVIAMSGPKEMLPRSTAEAEVLATCVAEYGRCDGDSGCYATHAASYLPAGLTVVAESMGMGSRDAQQ
jgi:hypothetical protein